MFKAKGLGFRVSCLLDVGPPSRHPHRRVPWAPEVSQTSLHACVCVWVGGWMRVCARARAYTHNANAQARGRARCTWCLCRHSRIAQLDGRPACPSRRATRVSVWLLVLVLVFGGVAAALRAVFIAARPLGIDQDLARCSDGRASAWQSRHCSTETLPSLAAAIVASALSVALHDHGRGAHLLRRVEELL